MAPSVLLAVDEPLVRWDWVGDHLDVIRDDLIEHIQLTALAVAIGFAIAMAMSLLAIRWRWTYGPLAGFCAVLYSIPSIALFAILIPITGLGVIPAEIALVGYTLLILLRNMVAGFDGVPPEVREAADGMGYEPWRRVLRVDLPLALPAVIAGLRIATVTTVGLVTVAALVGTGGLGDLINDGLNREFSTPVVVGSFLSVLLAITFDLLFVLIERLATPWARQGRRGEARLDPEAPAPVAATAPAAGATAMRIATRG
jgi:osmoprotectant transport system permease protein